MKEAAYAPSRFWRFVQAVLATLVIYVPFHAFVSTWLGTSIGPLWLWKSWKEGVIFAVALAAVAWVIYRKQLKQVFPDLLIQILCTYALIVIVCTLFGSAQTDAKLAGLAMDLRYLVVFGLGYLLVSYLPRAKSAWEARAPKLLVGAGLILAVIGVLQVTVLPLDVLSHFGYDKNETIAPYLLIDDNPNAPRAFATLRGPNDYGAYLILPLVVTLAYMVRLRDKLLLGIAHVAGLAVSASRSAWLGAVAAVATLSLLASKLSRKKLVVAGSTAIFLAVAVLLASISIPAVRLAVFHSSPGDSSLTEGSTDAHWQATAQGVDRVVEDPVDGCGAGCAGPASYYNDTAQISENYYVQIAETYGLIGLIVWITLFVLVLWRLWKSDSTLSTPLLAAGIGLSVIGLWLHVWSDDPLSLTWWALAGIVLGNTTRQTEKKRLS